MTDVLLVGNPSCGRNDIENAINSFSQQKPTFEQLDRILVLNLKKQYAKVQVITPNPYNITQDILKVFALNLAPSGTLSFTQYCCSETGVLMELPKNCKLLPLRTEKSLLSDLVMNGFISTNVVSKTFVSDDKLLELIKGVWMVPEDQQKLVFDLLKGNTVHVSVETSRPSYSLGSGAKLSFAKKSAVPVPVIKKETVWTVSAMDDDLEFENEDDLLDEEDLIVPPTAPAGDCSTKKKACKDCSCGRAEEEERQVVASITVVEPKKTVVSSCGSVSKFI
jgi:anamorsin